MQLEDLNAPFPWFGGKSRAAHLIWPRLGADVPNYIAPFCGSLAVELARPGGAGKIETVNDSDRFLQNFWRAIKADPWGVAEWCDDPVNEADMHARHKWLVAQDEFRERMHTDADYYDVKIAGWWVWGICCWIGGGWCAEPDNHKHPKLDGIGKGVHSLAGSHQKQQLPMLAVSGTNGMASGRGIHGAKGRGKQPRKLPHIAVKADGACDGRGVHSAKGRGRARNRDSKTRPHLSSEMGVHLPSLGNDRGIHGVSIVPTTYLQSLKQLSVPDAPPCFEWFLQLSIRLRRVRMICGDWRRVLSPSVLGKGKNVGGRRPTAVLLDPPYEQELRARGLYLHDNPISADVRAWAIEHGPDPDLRIVLCGYEGEHAMPDDWEKVEWEGARGYARADNENRKKERLWFSPHCLKPAKQRSLLDLIPEEHR